MKKLIICIIIVLFVQRAGFSQVVDPETLTSKTYKLTYKKVAKILPLLASILSNKSVVNSSEEFNLLVIKDYPPNLALVDSLVAKFDVPLRQIAVSVRLLYGFNPDPSSVDAETPTISDSTQIRELLGANYTFNKIIEIDRSFIRTEEKSRTNLELGAGVFNVAIDVDYIPGNPGIIKFRTFAVSEMISGIAGKELKLLINTSAELQDGTTELLTVFKKDDKSLIVLIGAQSM